AAPATRLSRASSRRRSSLLASRWPRRIGGRDRPAPPVRSAPLSRSARPGFVLRWLFALLGPLFLTQLGEAGGGGGDIAANLHVAFMAGVFEKLVVWIALPRDVDLVRRGQHDRVFDPRFVT